VKQSTSRRDWTQGSITRNLVSLSWPVMVSSSLNMIGPFIDMVWIGKLGENSVAGVGTAALAVVLANTALSGIMTGMRVIIGRSVGAGDKEAAIHAARQALVIGIIYAVIVAAIGIFLTEPILRAFGLNADVVKIGASYLRIQFIGIMTMSLLTFNEGTMQPAGDTMSPMRISLVYRGLHLLLCPFLVFGLWIFPKLGVQGAAISDVSTQCIGGIIGLWVLFSGHTRLKLTLKNWRFDLAAIWRMVKIGLPNGFMNIQQNLSNIVLMWFIVPFGTIAVAAHTLWQRVDGTLMVLVMGIGVSAGVMGAQNMGANKIDRAAKSGWIAAGFAAIVMFVGSTILLIFPEQIVRIFNTEPELVKMAATFLRISAANYIFLGISAIFRFFLVGIGDTIPAFLFEVIPTWCLLIPMVFLVTRYTDWGIYGIRWSMAVRWILAGFIFTTYFWWGKWKQKKV